MAWPQCKKKKEREEEKKKKKRPMLQSLLVLVTDYFSHLKIRLLVEGRAGEGKRREGKGRGGDDVWDENGLCAFVVVFLCVFTYVYM